MTALRRSVAEEMRRRVRSWADCCSQEFDVTPEEHERTKRQCDAVLSRLAALEQVADAARELIDDLGFWSDGRDRVSWPVDRDGEGTPDGDQSAVRLRAAIAAVSTPSPEGT